MQKMKVAYCLYGQPRLAQRGHNNITAFLKRQNVTVDFYFHVWHDPTKTHFDSSPWRAIPADELEIKKDTIRFLLDAYMPTLCQIECPRTLDVPAIQESIMFHNSDHITRTNLNNTLSQMYSKQRVRDLVAPRAHEYDLIIASRFDFVKPIELDLKRLNPSKMYVADFRLPQTIFPDNFVVCNPNMFLRVFGAYADLEIMMNDRTLHHKMKSFHGEQAVLITENILFASFLRHFSVQDHVVFTPLIPDFH